MPKLLAKQFTKKENRRITDYTLSLPDIKNRTFYRWILFH